MPLAPPLSANACRSRRFTSRPPAVRICAFGRTKRKTANARRISSGGSGLLFSNGVPGIGVSIFRGTLSMPSSFRVKAHSTRCSRVSPRPKIPPLQTRRPAACAFLINNCPFQTYAYIRTDKVLSNGLRGFSCK